MFARLRTQGQLVGSAVHDPGPTRASRYSARQSTSHEFDRRSGNLSSGRQCLLELRRKTLRRLLTDRLRHECHPTLPRWSTARIIPRIPYQPTKPSCSQRQPKFPSFNLEYSKVQGSEKIPPTQPDDSYSVQSPAIDRFSADCSTCFTSPLIVWGGGLSYGLSGFSWPSYSYFLYCSSCFFAAQQQSLKDLHPFTVI